MTLGGRERKESLFLIGAMNAVFDADWISFSMWMETWAYRIDSSFEGHGHSEDGDFVIL